MNDTQEVTRPALADWMFKRGLKAKHGAVALDCATQTVWRYCLPFSDPNRAVPGVEMMIRIARWTRGDVTAASFYPPAANGEPVEDAPAASEAEQRVEA